jgi:hypothetical protein
MQSIVDHLINKMMTLLHIEEEQPDDFRPWTDDHTIVSGFQFQNKIRDLAPTEICCCCMRRCAKPSVQWMPFDSVPNKHLLTVSNNTETPAFITTTIDEVEYRMYDSVACFRQEPEVTVHICNECCNYLKREKVPVAAVANIDPGLPPPHLPKLTYLESVILAPIRTMRSLVICKSVLKNKTPATTPNFMQQKAVRGHVIAFPAARPEQLVQVFPAAMDELPDHVQVVLVSAAKNLDELRAKARKAPCLIVRGKVIAMWARHLAAHYNPTKVQLSTALLNAYEQSGDDVPSCLLEEAIHASSVKEATAAKVAMFRDKRGYANTR